MNERLHLLSSVKELSRDSMNAAIYRFAPYTGSLKIKQQTFCLVHSLFQFVWLSEDVYIITPSCHSVKYFFEGNFGEIVFIGLRRVYRPLGVEGS